MIRLALENNRDLRLAALNVEKARAMYGIRKAELFPAVNAAGAYAKQRRSADLISPGEPRTVEQYSVDLGWPPGKLTFSDGSAICRTGPWRRTWPRTRPAVAHRSCWWPKFPKPI